MLRKVLAGIISAAVITTLFAGCSTKKEPTNANGGEKKEKTEISFMAFSATPNHEKEVKEMMAEFEKQNEDIKVNYEAVAYNDYFTKLQTLLASGKAPDTFELNYENFVNYASKGALLDLTEQIAKDKSFNPSVYDKTSYDVFNYKGKQYGLVESFSNVVLFYNKDLFDKAEVKYPDESWTWKEELEAAQKLTDESNKIWGSYSPIQFWEFYKTIAQNGGSMFNKDMTEVTINSKENVETLQWMIDKINKHKVTPSDAQMGGQSDGDLFKAGKIAMLRTGIWMFSSFKDAPFNWDIALEPGNTKKAHHFFANAVAASAKTKNAEAAWKWMRFFTSSKEATTIRVNASWELPAISDRSILDAYLKQTPPPSRQVVFDALKTLVTPPVIEKSNELADIVNKELEAAKLGKKTAQKALDDAKVEIEKLIK
jgi:multiple sugar transport system substrate-binding protein